MKQTVTHIPNTPGPMCYGALREKDDLADEFYDIAIPFDLGDGKILTRIGFVLLMLCWFGIGVGVGIYLGKHFAAP